MTKKLILLFFLALAIALVVFLALQLNKVTFQKETQPSAEAESKIEEEAKQRIIALAPVNLKDFTVLYNKNADVFLVTIETKPFDESKTKAIDWFKSFGINNLCTLNINWWASRYVKETLNFTTEELATPGCQ